MVSANGGPKKFFYARTLRVLAPHILQINIAIVRFVIEYMIVCCRSSLKMFYKKICWEKMDMYDFVVVGPSALRASEARSAEAYTSGMDYKSILTIWFSIEISRNEWDIGFWGLIWLLQKNGGNFWILRDRRKGFSERPKKVHFWKIHFQNLL